MPLTQVCPPLINSTTGHYNSTGMHSTSLWLAFLASVCTARESSGMQLRSARQHEYALPRPPASEIWMPKYSGQAAVVPMVSALEWFHCIHLSPCFYGIYITCGSSLVPRPHGRRETSLSSHMAWVQGQYGSYCLVSFMHLKAWEQG